MNPLPGPAEQAAPPRADAQTWELRLYVAGQTPRSIAAFAIPTLVRKLPEPLRRIVGDLSNTERTLIGLQLRPPNRARSEREGQR